MTGGHLLSNKCHRFYMGLFHIHFDLRALEKGIGFSDGVVWCGVVWCGVVWCGVVWCGVVWCGVVWCGVM